MPPIVWMDMEMTGLDPERDRIIEIALLITDDKLQTIAEGPELVVSQPDELLSAMDEWNTKHHSASGLVERVKASSVSEAEAQAQVMAVLKEHCPERECPLAGNSIHQDRRFIVKYMPEIEAWLHYRNIDVSTIKELAQRWYPLEYAGRPVKKGDHRAMADLKESIDELRYYRDKVFRATE